ncbi:MAG TPA: hypothetical protein VMJ12_08750 [Candidatus Acidoferrales bacterium]|nr:hypothetical protein [Candidatus Acidoferrales bacterium]
MMNGEMEQFELRLNRQPLREVPAEWREEILAAAGRASSVERRGQGRFEPSTLVSRLSTLFWPHPVAWAGLAAIWVFILGVDFSQRGAAPVVAESHSPPSVEINVEVRQQRRLLAEMLGPRETREAEQLRIFFPRPRSELRIEILTT